jgi:hypothetical protein
MALDTSIELRAYNPALAGSLVLNRLWQLTTDGVPVEAAPVAAYFHVRDNGRTKLELTFGSGLTWIDQLKAVHIQITNEQVAFIRASSEMDYSFYVIFDHGAVQTIREGTVTAVKVA